MNVTYSLFLAALLCIRQCIIHVIVCPFGLKGYQTVVPYITL